MRKTSPIAALFMIAFLALSCTASFATFYLKGDKLVPERFPFMSYINGKAALSFEKKFEERLIIRDQLVGAWGAIQYGLFKSGGRKVVVGSNDWLFTTEEFETLKDADEAEHRLLILVKNTNEQLKANNIRLVVALVPAKARIYPEYLGKHVLPADRAATYDRVRSAITNLGIPAPDLAALFQNNKNEDTPLYFRLDTHWTPEGSALAAQAIAEAAGTLEGIKKTSFTVEAAQPETFEGDLEKYIKTGVFEPYFSPARDAFARRKIGKTDSESGGLFGDEDIPVALIGTSYSAIDKWNFEGALKAALQSDVLNLADEGQGPLEPMAKFLKDTDLKSTPIKLVIWEIPERFVPTTYGDVKFPETIEDKN